MHVVGSPGFGFKLGSDVLVLCNNNPTGMALGVLCTFLNSELARDCILEAGGAPAFVGLLKESTCPDTVTITALGIKVLLHPTDARPGGNAAHFFESGE